ncbi:MAG: hypothetical protein ACTHL8_18930 [Burkholderiaceae bacterium]
MSATGTLILAIEVCLAIHLFAMASAGVSLGLPLAELRFGFGAVWLRLGFLHLGVLPLGGYVRFRESPSGRPAQETLGLASELVLALAGVLALLLVAGAADGAAGLAAFGAGFPQWVAGALSPLGAAQAMLRAARHQAFAGTFAATLGLAAAKVAALNLLPYPGTNAWQALAAIGRRLGLARHWPEGLSMAFLVVQWLSLASWLVAILVFASRR